VYLVVVRWRRPYDHCLVRGFAGDFLLCFLSTVTDGREQYWKFMNFRDEFRKKLADPRYALTYLQGALEAMNTSFTSLYAESPRYGCLRKNTWLRVSMWREHSSLNLKWANQPSTSKTSRSLPRPTVRTKLSWKSNAGYMDFLLDEAFESEILLPRRTVYRVIDYKQEGKFGKLEVVLT
jgi:hypothetical protein